MACPVSSPPGPPGSTPSEGCRTTPATLTRCLDAQGHRQTVLTSRLGGPRGTTRLGRAATVQRTGLADRPSPPAVGRCRPSRRSPPPHPRVDVVHAHQGEDLAVLPSAVLAARRHRCPLVVTVHCSVAHTLTGRVAQDAPATPDRWVDRERRPAPGGCRRRPHRADGGPAAHRRGPGRADHDHPLRLRPGAVLREPGRRLPGAGPAPGRLRRPAGAAEATRPAGPRLRPHDPAGRARGRRRRTRRRPRPAAGRGESARRPHHPGRLRRPPRRSGRLASLDVLVLPSAYEEMGSVLTEAIATRPAGGRERRGRDPGGRRARGLGPARPAG